MAALDGCASWLALQRCWNPGKIQSRCFDREQGLQVSIGVSQHWILLTQMQALVLTCRSPALRTQVTQRLPDPGGQATGRRALASVWAATS